METRLTVALAQVEGHPDPRHNLRKARVLVREAAERGAHLFVLPEMFMGLPTPERPPAQLAREEGQFFTRMIASMAQLAGLYIAVGCWEEGPTPGLAYNTARLFSPAGEIVASYRKIHLFDALSVRESDTMAAGDEPPPVVTAAGMKIGLAICYDLRFPEIFRYLAASGAQLILVPSAWYQGPVKELHWTTLLQARAIENTLYVAGCNLVGGSFCGRSAVFDPFGIPLAGAGETEDLLFATASSGRIAAVRAKLPALANRRAAVESLSLRPCGGNGPAR
ncbi:MAG: carbon-nitrogen hydrolase family protein [Desulfobacterales bacterium]